MSWSLRIVLIVLSVGSLGYIIRKIRFSRMQIEYAIFWICMSVIMIIMAVFPQIVWWITRAMGMVSAANVVYIFIIGLLLAKVFMMTIEISNLEKRVKDVAQAVGIDEKEYSDELKKDTGRVKTEMDEEVHE